MNDLRKYYQVTITDRDGEVQEYTVVAVSVWHITDHIGQEMLTSGDFYGHKREDTISLDVAELFQPALSEERQKNAIRLPFMTDSSIY